MVSKKIYLAIPYTGIEEQSFYIANKLSAELMNQGHIVFSPISHSHPMAIQENLPQNWEYWKTFDEEFIKWADEVHVIKIGDEGDVLILNSTGVKAEMQIAVDLSKPIKFIQYKEELCQTKA